MRRKLAAGNWKMNGSAAALAEIDALTTAYPNPKVDIVIAPPATLIAAMAAQTKTHPFGVGAQTCHPNPSGAHTGDLSAPMLKDAGASHIITGHSERRTDHGETDADVCAQTRATQAEGLTAIVCIGETLAERDAAKTLDIIARQLAGSLPDTITSENTVVAYEPVWAIGTGKVATLDQIGEVHDFIRANLEHRFGADTGGSIRILYGGSVKPDNAKDIFNTSNVDGALVGGASLKSKDFSGIINALEASH